MSGVREKKKLKTRKTILDVSKKLFLQKGYKNVKTSEIAELAEIGEGTLFNYFKSKGELFISALFEGFMTRSYRFNSNKRINEEELLTEIINITDFYVKDVRNIKKELIREYLSIIYDYSNSEAKITKQILVNADEIIISNLRVLFNYAIENIENASDFNIEIAIRCIYSCSITVFNEYVYDDEMSYEEMIETIKEQIIFIIKGKMKWKID